MKTTQQQDYERYEELGRAMREMLTEAWAVRVNSKYMDWWREREAIKNKYGGMPPKAVKEEGK